MRDISGGRLRADAATALAEMASAAAAAGVGEVALASGFRSYATQRSTYQRQVSPAGRAEADTVSARPGLQRAPVRSRRRHHRVRRRTAPTRATIRRRRLSRSGSPRTRGSTAGSSATSAGTPVTGYSPEPWHLRYIGPELAAAYHAGGWQHPRGVLRTARRAGLRQLSGPEPAFPRRSAASHKRGTEYRRIMRCNVTASSPHAVRVA